MDGLHEQEYDLIAERGPNPGRYAGTGLETTDAAGYGAALDICRACPRQDDCRALGLFATEMAFQCASDGDYADEAEMYRDLAGGGHAG